MTIAVECPHCEARFQLGEELAGKAMRCPECRETFTVSAVAAAPPVPTAPPRSEPMLSNATGGVGEFVPVLEVESSSVRGRAELPYERVESDRVAPMQVVPEMAEARSSFVMPGEESGSPPVVEEMESDAPVARRVPPKPQSKPAPFAKLAPKSPPAPESAPTAPRVVAWTGAAAPPVSGPPTSVPPAYTPPAFAAPALPDRDDDVPFTRRPRKNPWPKFILFGLLVVLGGFGAWILYASLTYNKRTEQRRADEAEEAYKAANFAVASQKYTEVSTAFPESERIDEYRFFVSLADVRATVDSVSTRENPGPPKAKLEEFLAQNETSPFAQPARFGADVVQTGRKMAESLTGHAADKLKKFRADQERFDGDKGPDLGKVEDLVAAETAVVDSAVVLDKLDKFRDREGPGFDDLRKSIAEATETHRKERKRLDVLLPFRQLADDPTDESIEQCEATFRANALIGDPAAKWIVTKAKIRLRELIGSVANARPAVRAPADALPTTLFTAAAADLKKPRVSPDVVPDVVFAVARGVLYALDADSGETLWGTRVASQLVDAKTADVPVRVNVGEEADWVLVPSDVNGQRGIGARDARTGTPKWYQPLPASLAGRPVVVGRRAYVPLADDFGTVVELLLSTGAQVSTSSIRQPIGAGLAALPGLQPGGGFLFVPADARRVFVFEVGKLAGDGSVELPKCVRIIPTEHLKMSLRGEPLLVAPAVGDGPRYLILTQSDGPTAMRLRSFPLPSPDKMYADIAAPPATTSAEVAVAGWAWFPPATNGERVLATTDAGAVAVFGVNQLGNADKPLFALPVPPPADQEAVNRSLVVSLEEDSAWVVLGGQLVRLQVSMDQTAGFQVKRGTGRQIGEPVHRAQVRALARVGVVTTQQPGGHRATAFDLQTGLLIWQRHLGAVAAAPPILAAGLPTVVADEGGGVYTVPTEDAEGSTTAAPLAPPVTEPLGKAVVARSADGKTVWVLVPEKTNDGRRLRARLIVNGAITQDSTVPLPDLLAGNAVLLGTDVLLPLANGTVYRLAAGGKELVQGPTWRAAGANADTTCGLTAIAADEFLAADGTNRVIRWRWPAGAAPVKLGNPYEVKGTVVLPPAVVPGDKLQFAVADATGRVTLFDGTQAAEVRSWRGAPGTDFPPGTPGVRLDGLTIDGKPRLVYAIDRRHVVCLDPEADAPSWSARVLPEGTAAEIVGWSVRGRHLLVTDQTGRVAVYDASDGKLLTDVRAGGALAAREAVPLGGDRVLLTLGDGTTTVLTLPRVAGAKNEN